MNSQVITKIDVYQGTQKQMNYLWRLKVLRGGGELASTEIQGMLATFAGFGPVDRKALRANFWRIT
jgi:hypothetical protein